LLFAYTAISVSVSNIVFENSIDQKFNQSTGKTHGKLSMNFKFTSSGVSESNLVQWNITNNVGTMVIGGKTYQTAAYYTQVMGDPGDWFVRWFDLVGIADDGSNLAIVYLGCLPPPVESNNTIQSVWEEDYNDQLSSDSPPEADCGFTDLANKPDYDFEVTFPSLNGVPQNTLDTQVQIKGKEVFLDGSYGWMIVDGHNYTIAPISTVDCSDCGQNCIECPTAPWYELHFIYYSSSLQQTGFGIFYIYPYDRTYVQFNYTICFPTLDTPAITYEATWTGTPPGRSRTVGLPIIMSDSSDVKRHKY